MTCTKNHFYVDESGDLTLFGRRGKILVGTEGVTRFFMVGVAQIEDPARLKEDMRALRARLLADPYLTGIHSMMPANQKTAMCFHAKDDCPEVRREVFSLLRQHNIKVLVAVRRKAELAQKIRSERKLGIRWQPNAVYDDLVKRIFRDLLHRADENDIVVARRGKGDRIAALTESILKARKNFYRRYKITSDKPASIAVDVPSNFAGLQAVDYCLWALQRLYERGEERYFSYLADKFRLVMDLDDKRNKPYGEYYSDRNPLSAKKTKPATG